MVGERDRKHGEEKEEGFGVVCEVNLPIHAVCLDKWLSFWPALCWVCLYDVCESSFLKCTTELVNFSKNFSEPEDNRSEQTL